MVESVDLFDEICNGQWFSELPIILVFNVSRSNLPHHFPESRYFQEENKEYST
jgi:hypothetical protein